MTPLPSASTPVVSTGVRAAFARRARRLFALLSVLFAAAWLCGCKQRPASAQPVPEPQASVSASSAQTAASNAAGDGCAGATGAEQPACQGPLETAVLAGGCFWGMEDILRKIPGVRHTEVGYTGGSTAAPRYEAVSTGATGHAESVRVVFDPRVLSYAHLLEHWFFRMHDPTTKDRQGNDRGTQYRSAIFFTSPEQEQVARDIIRRVDASKKWPAPIVTEVVAAGTFTPAEDYHQDYLQKNPGGYTCHYLRD